ncbi:MAG: acetyltransferase [Oscillospiraceae bacterium]|nr:acetyltransferase [Oscillospiraceae bacterium]
MNLTINQSGDGIKRLLIIGTSGHGKSVLDCVLAANQYETVVFATKDPPCPELAGYPVFYEQEHDIESLRNCCDEFIVAIGDNCLRWEIFNRYLQKDLKPAVIIHPRAAVSPLAQIKAGTVIHCNAVVGPFAAVGHCCIINTSSVVEHDCVINDAVHISPGAALGGGVSVGQKSWVCIGSSVANNLRIGSNSVIAAGAAVINDIPDNVLAAGVPAIIKKQI